MAKGAYIGVPVGIISATLTNLITDNFSNTSYWTAYNTSTFTVSGNVATTVGKSTWSQLSKENIAVGANDILYSRVKVKHASSTSMVQAATFDVRDASSTTFVRPTAYTNYGDWGVMSSRGSVGATSAAMILLLPLSNTSTGACVSGLTVYWSEVMMVNLTQAFGAGNEPAIEWCDENIPFFTGTTTIEYTPSNYGQSVARKIKKGYVGVDGVARKIKKGYIGVNGVARQFFGRSNPYLQLMITNNRDGATYEYEVTDEYAYGYVSGGTGTSYEEVAYMLYKDDKPYLLPAGSTVKFSFTGTRRGNYCDYLMRACTDLSDTYGSRVTQYANSSQTDKTYTVTTPCYVFFFASIGGTTSSGLYASINITKVLVDGVDVFPGEEVET